MQPVSLSLPQPVQHDSRVYKAFLAGTHRLVHPNETVRRMMRLMPVLGITRIANVTGLDTIGIPVVMVTRPNSRSLSVSQGKGHDLSTAKASGLMESIEMWHAEQIDLPLKLATYNELRHTHRMADVAALPHLSVSQFHGNYRTLWIEGQDLLADHARWKLSELPPSPARERGVGGVRSTPGTWVPYEMVHTDYTVPLPSGSGSFLMSSSGLASGNHPLEALSHALSELIERDATTLFRYSSKAVRRAARVDLSTVDDSGCRNLLDRYDSADILVAVWEMTSDVGVAAFTCTIVDRDPNPARPIGPMGGMGCHPSRAVALSRALTEAAQSRLTVITGARDDVRHDGPQGPDGDLVAAKRARDWLVSEPAERSFLDAPDFQADTFQQDVDHLLARLSCVGIRQVIAVDLTKRIFGIPVVRVIVPGLEALHEVPGYLPGVRAQKKLKERQS